MTRELTTTNSKAIDVQRLRVTVASLYASIKRDDRSRCDTLPKMLNSEVRQALQDYRRDLHGRLQPISNAMVDREKAAAAVGGFLQGYINARSSDPAGTVRSYVQALADQPLFAIYEAIDDFKHRRVFDINEDGERVLFTVDHAPSAPRLLDQVKKRAADVQEERYKVVRLLSITKVAEPEISPAERERVSEAMRQFAEEMSKAMAATKAQERQENREQADAARERARRIVEDARARREFESAEARVIG